MKKHACEVFRTVTAAANANHVWRRAPNLSLREQAMRRNLHSNDSSGAERVDPIYNDT